MRGGPFAVALLALLAGCLDETPDPEEPGPPVDDVEPADPWQGVDSMLVSERVIGEGDIQEFDMLCAFGGSAFLELPRTARILNGTTELLFHVESGASTTATQAGFAKAGGEIEWLPPVALGSETFHVPLAPADSEEAGTPWTFHYQINLPAPADQECYTGFSRGGYAVHVEAVRGPA